jgi:hypothetical protein
MTHGDTKAHWKRRALRAEAELETMRKIRAVDNSMELKLVSENAALRIAIDEISELLDDLSFSLPGDKL